MNLNNSCTCFCHKRSVHLREAYDKLLVLILHKFTEIWLNRKLFLMLIYVNAVFDVASTCIEAA